MTSVLPPLDIPAAPVAIPADESIRGWFLQAMLSSYHNSIGSDDLPVLQVPQSKDPRKIKVGILGAGAAGLYAAMIINSLEDPYITCEILEKNDNTQRHGGGRLYTHSFKGLDAPYTDNDYFDIGAMRFPMIPFMRSVQFLFLDDKSPIKDKIHLIKYHMGDPNGNSIIGYNNIKYTSGVLKEMPSNDPFKTGVKIDFKAADGDYYAFGPLRNALMEPNVNHEWIRLMQEYDRFSVRQYLTTGTEKLGLGWTSDLVDLLETFNSGTNSYDTSLIENVLHSLDFDWRKKPTDPDPEWKCIQGGAGRLADAMKSTLKDGQIEYNRCVNRIAMVEVANPTSNTPPENVAVKVYFDNEHDSTSETYEHVITTLPFGCLRLVDTSECRFSWELQNAIRMLRYDSSVKIGIQFKSRWWENTGKEAGGNKLKHTGGSTKTDRISRVTVYPSYGIGTDGSSGATMIASYTWTQDALRIGAYALGKDSRAEKLLMTEILDDLAWLHDLDRQWLQDQMVDYKIHDWYRDEDSCGAFAVFGPGQFSTLYKHVTSPAGSVLHFAGEATSIHHAWVEGALCSAFRSVAEILLAEGRTDLYSRLVDPKGDNPLSIPWPLPEELNLKILEQQVAIGQQWPAPQL